MPLEELWTIDDGPIAAAKECDVDAEDIRELLRQGSIRFLLVTLDDAPRWVDHAECFTFWKAEVRGHVYDRERPRREDYTGEYFYFAASWLLESGERVIVLEKRH